MKLKRIPFLFKTIALVLGVLIIFSSSILMFYHVTAPGIFAENKIRDLTNKGQIISNYIESVLRGEISSAYLVPLIGRSTSQWECSVWVVDSQGNTLIRTQQMDGRRTGRLPSALSDAMLPNVLAGNIATHVGEADKLLTDESKKADPADSDAPDLADNLDVNELSDVDVDEETLSGSIVAVAIPLLYYGETVGAVFMVQSMDDIMSGMATLSNSLTLSLALVPIFFLPIILFFSLMVSRPLSRMRLAALSMAKGDLAVRASEAQKDEFGELGHALNFLASELGTTITSLELEKTKLQSTIDGLSEGILTLDSDGKITLTNPAFYALMHFDSEITNVHDLSPELNSVFEEVMEKGEIVVRTIWHGDTALRISMSPLRQQNGTMSGCVSVISDVTSAERLEQTRKDYVANVSHELRTPLTAMRGLIEPLRDGLIKTEEQRQQTYNVILRETMRLSRLVNDMLELSRLQSGTLSLERTVFQPKLLLDQVYETYSGYAEDYNHTLIYNVPDVLPTTIGNPDRTQQVLVALLDNAFKYTPDGGTVTIEADILPDVLKISVKDTGIGISESDLPHVFDRFYKVDKSHHSKGTGLGLAIAYEIMKQLGETMTVSSTVGEGSQFSFTLHLAEQRLLS